MNFAMTRQFTNATLHRVRLPVLNLSRQLHSTGGIICLVLFLLSIRAPAQNSLPATNFLALDHEHTDGLTLLYNASATNPLQMIAWQRDLSYDLLTNQVIFVAKTQAMLTLPSGTPFGNGGQPFWILPQTQNPNLLYLGVNAERIPAGVFNGSLTIQLKRFQGPGYFMAWQAIGPGQYNIRINTRDGIDTNDFFSPLTGSHEHFNWGFSTTGVYSVTFQAFGQRIGETTNIFSPESTYVFQILPLPPPTNYLTWARSYWPPGFNPPTTVTNGNPDGDLFTNLLEYAFGLSPTNANGITNAPLFSFVTTNGQKFGALTFTHYKPALDLNYTVEASSALPGNWVTLTNTYAIAPGNSNTVERVTMHDFLPATNGVQRFYRLKTTLF
jgi:surface-anchored protein